MASFAKVVWGSSIVALALVVSTAPLSAQGRLSQRLQKHVASRSTQTVDVIVHGTPDQIRAIAARHGLSIKKTLLEGAVLQADAAGVEALAAEVDHVSPDADVASFMSVSNAAIGADQVQAGLEGLSEFTGKGIGIALLDSGVWTGHRSLAGRVVYSKDFVGDGKVNQDPYGHGTHIGATIAGSSPYPQDSTSQAPFRGVAPGANLISLRVIGADGMGKASSVMDAIDWVIRHRKRFNIRVINVSLGGAADESYRDDPMCKAVERAVHAGIVVVVAAGNRGKDAEGRSVHGLIESPGIDPYVITVGALNTKGTAARSDDELATYSSKGPTAVDRLLKPDIAAPGNKIVSAEALGGSLVAEHSFLHASGSGADAYATLSGTSMATGVVSGTVALVLEANKGLTPGLVKMTLQSSATFMREVGVAGAGAGSLNAAAAIGAALHGPTQQTTSIGGETVKSSGVMIGTSRQIAGSSGRDLRSHEVTWVGKVVLGDEILWGDHLIWGDEILWGDRVIQGDEILWGDQVIRGDEILWGDQVIRGDEILWGDRIIRADAILWGDHVIWNSEILWGDHLVWGDEILWGDQLIWGDEILWGD